MFYFSFYFANLFQEKRLVICFDSSIKFLVFLFCILSSYLVNISSFHIGGISWCCLDVPLFLQCSAVWWYTDCPTGVLLFHQGSFCLEFGQFCDISFNSQEKKNTGKEKRKKAVLDKKVLEDFFHASQKVLEEE